MRLSLKPTLNPGAYVSKFSRFISANQFSRCRARNKRFSRANSLMWKKVTELDYLLAEAGNRLEADHSSDTLSAEHEKWHDKFFT